MHKDSRIAVIGAGAAGLSAAWYLQQRGYLKVQVLEREQQVGGKCYTVATDGRNFDLGAFTVTPGYRYTRELARAVGMPLIRQPERKVFDISAAWIGSINQGLRRKFGFFKLLVTSARYLHVLWRYRRWLAVPGFAGLAERPELTQPFGSWVRQHRMEALVDMFRLAVKDMGYGSPEDIPTVYILKYMHAWNFITLMLYTVGLRHWPRRFRFGFARLWQAVALPLNLQTGITITAITRRAEDVQIQLAGEKQARVYDAVIIACQPDSLAGVMDYRAEEQALFGQLKTTRYCTTLARVEGMPAMIFNATDDDPMSDYLPGHPWEMLRAWPDSDHATFYAMLDPNNNLQAVQRHIATDLDRLFGARLVGVVEQHEWPYFPHVNSQAMRAGYFERLEGLQGLRRSYYTGGLLAFETVENVVAYSRALVDQHFPPQH